jgi:hypothetical protein
VSSPEGALNQELLEGGIVDRMEKVSDEHYYGK